MAPKFCNTLRPMGPSCRRELRNATSQISATLCDACDTIDTMVTIIIGYNATNTGNNVASLQYNNNNRADVTMPAGCCDDAEARRKTQR